MDSKKIFICQSNYIPWKGYFDAINEADVFVVYDEMQYTKNDWRNRNKIKTPQGVQWLTIPIKLNFGQKINEAKTSQRNWQKKHLKTLQQNYSKAPYYEEIMTLLHDLYKNNLSENISEINIAFFKTVSKYLNIKTKVIRSSALIFEGDKNERLIQICKQLNCNHYLSGPAAKSYINLDLFSKENITVEFLDYSGYPEYNQLFNEFEHGVTILDLLFNEGENSLNYLKFKSNKKY